MANLTRGPPNRVGYYVESLSTQRLAFSEFRHLLHISAVCA
jgi:hypothetical protein